MEHKESIVTGFPILINNASFSWDKEGIEYTTLKNISLKIEPGRLVAIIGDVGSGKSSLLLAILKEMRQLSGEMYTQVTKK